MHQISFLPQAGTATLLVLLTICLQSIGMGLMIHWVRFQLARAVARAIVVQSVLIVIRLAIMMIAIHMLEVLLWAAFYRRLCLPSWETSIYFSLTSYSSVGYGDVLLPRTWRILGPLEALTGVLMCGLSVSGLFAVVTRLVGRYDTLHPER